MSSSISSVAAFCSAVGLLLLPLCSRRTSLSGLTGGSGLILPLDFFEAGASSAIRKISLSPEIDLGVGQFENVVFFGGLFRRGGLEGSLVLLEGDLLDLGASSTMGVRSLGTLISSLEGSTSLQFLFAAKTNLPAQFLDVFRLESLRAAVLQRTDMRPFRSQLLS